jgi:hypothetical protein
LARVAVPADIGGRRGRIFCPSIAEVDVIRVPFEGIGRNEIEALVSNQVAEDRTLEYKEYLPTDNRSKRNFICAVASLANAEGGDIVLGVEEARHGQKKLGWPKKAWGLGYGEFDEMRRSLESMLRQGSDPPIVGVRFCEVRGFERGPVVVMGIVASAIGPHMVTYQDDHRFYGRGSGGKYTMDASELRRAYGLSEAIPSRLRALRSERNSLIEQNATPMPMGPYPATVAQTLDGGSSSITGSIDPPKVVIEFVPLSSLTFAANVDFSAVAPGDLTRLLFPLASGGCSWRHNIDGMLTFATQHDAARRSVCTSYVQAFRNGILEAVSRSAFVFEPNSQLVVKGQIVGLAIEHALIDLVWRFSEFEKLMAVEPPFFVMVTLLAVEGFTMVQPDCGLGTLFPIDRNEVFLGEVAIDQHDFDSAILLKPIFDSLWQACGSAACPHYGTDGAWSG